MKSEKDNSIKSKEGKVIIDDKKLSSLFAKASAKFKQTIKSLVNRLPGKDDSRWDKLGFERNWKFIAPLIVALCAIGIIKLVPMSAFILIIVIVAVVFIWLVN